MIAIVDYGITNLGSMLNMLRRVGARAEAVSTPQAVRAAAKLILPGIGHFDYGVSALNERGLVEPLRECAMAGIPLLGVCLGMQLLGHGSEEGSAVGLGLVDAYSRRFHFSPGNPRRVPHMGWNTISARRDDPLLGQLDAAARFYFVHSYYVECMDPTDSLATTEYGTGFTAVLQHGNVYGVQFHPEKSHRYGLQLLANFAAI
jgi:glutamine amidotransferase